MALAFFYNEEIKAGQEEIILNEETSRHVVQVLRMQAGGQIQITDGKGNLFVAGLSEPHKKKTVVKIITGTFIKASEKKVSIAISLIKNQGRFEWFLEKATEIGVNEIIPVISARTEKQHFRYERMKAILISAMLQSQQVWLPVLHEPVQLTKFLQSAASLPKLKFIAHCIESENKIQLPALGSSDASIILIGPEGDFTKEEINESFKNNFTPVTLGQTRLRTETAGIVAATLLRMS